MVVQQPDGTLEFRFYRPDIDSLALVGDFNGWHESAFAMRSDGNGWWGYRLKLAPGCYEFRYRSDWEWFTDYAAFGVHPTAMGLNSVLQVAPAKTAARSAERDVVRMPAFSVDGMLPEQDAVDRRTTPNSPAESPNHHLEPAVA